MLLGVDGQRKLASQQDDEMKMWCTHASDDEKEGRKALSRADQDALLEMGYGIHVSMNAALKVESCQLASVAWAAQLKAGDSPCRAGQSFLPSADYTCTVLRTLI